MAAPIDVDDIPGPRGVPFLGNVFDIDSHSPVEGLVQMARQYGPIYKVSVPAGTRLMISDPDLVNEICDDARFDKKISAGLVALSQSLAGRGLFTSETSDPLWQRAHNILMAPFSLQAMRDYVPRMLDIANQLTDKWTRLNPGDEVDVPASMTALTLDTIALCGFDYRFNSFYRDTPHPFVEAMVRSLLTAQARARRLPALNRLRIREQRQLDDDQMFMKDLVGKLIAERRQQGGAADNSDLLGRMLTGVDPQSGKGLPDDNIISQCLTFLIAGHETTSGLLSFAIYYLVKNPEYAKRARTEIDEVFGDSASPSYEQVHRLTYVLQILEESLRLWPTAPLFTRTPRTDTVIGGRYAVPAGIGLTVLIPMLHRHQGVWGADVEQFNPDHLSPQHKTALPPNAYKPFGTGQRACIGRQFALQEATLVLGMLLQRFELVDHLNYQLKTKQTLTVKPDEFRIQVRPREGRTLARTGAAPTAARAARAKAEPPVPPVPATAQHGTPLRVLFGSNLGTAEAIANKLASEGTERGFAVTLGPLDDHIDDLPADGAILLVCSSYNGTPPENAVAFCRWLRDPKTPKDACAGASYAVFGCGDTQWAATYQAVPKLLDTELEEHGARRIHARGAGDAEADFDGQYRAWHDGLWRDVAAALNLPSSAAEPASTAPRLSISIVNRQLTNPVILSYKAHPAQVRENRELERPSDKGEWARSIRHIEVALPSGTTYRAGDHLGVLPRNGVDVIRRVMRRFALDAGMYLTIIPKSGKHTHLPIDEPAPLLGVLGSCVELQDVASREDIEVLARYNDNAEQRAALEALAKDDDGSQARYRQRVAEPNRSALDLLYQFPACRVPFEVYLDLLPPLRPRYYSISSSALVAPDVCSITVGVLRAPARAGDGVFQGICSNYLASMTANSTLFVFVREPTIPFRQPEDPSVPMIMVGAGTGLAPFRGFLQERAALLGRGVAVGRSVLFFGCRYPQDYIYEDELRDFEKRGVVRLHTVFSRQPVDGRSYVQHEMLAHQDEVWELIQKRAAILVCGNANTMAPGVRGALADIYRNRTGGSAEDAQSWLADLRSKDRFLEDIWGGG